MPCWRNFPQLAERLDNAGGSLSGGEQQMLAIGRALMANPSADPDGRAVRRACRPSWCSASRRSCAALRESGHAILLVEQNLALALSVADRIHVISSGRFVFDGTPDELDRNAGVLDSHLGVAAGRCIDCGCALARATFRGNNERFRPGLQTQRRSGLSATPGAVHQ